MSDEKDVNRKSLIANRRTAFLDSRFSIHDSQLLLVTRLSLAAAFFAVLAWLAGAGVVAQKESELSPQEVRGKLIYLKGEGGGRGEITASLGGGGDLEIPATAFPCANCHGLTGEGTKEGGIQPPPIDWATLTAPHTSALTRRTRGPYDEKSLERAITLGVEHGGAPLHPAMPRYKMTAEQAGDLIAYLRKLGREADPGLSESAIRVGAALPLTGPLAQVGEDVRAALAAYFAEVNARGVYGRRFELVVVDSRGDSAGTLEATRRLVEQERVFVLVASFEPRGSEETNEYLSRSGVPLIGPVTLSPRVTVPPNAYVFYLLPTFTDQARALVDFLAAKSSVPRPSSSPGLAAAREAKGAARSSATAPRLAMVSSDSEFDADAVAGVRAQARLHSMEIVAEQKYVAGRFSAALAAEALQRAAPDHVFFFGPPDDILAFAREMERTGLSATLLSSTVMLGRNAFSLPASVAARTYLSFPAELPTQMNLVDFTTTMSKAGVQLRSPAFQSVAYAAAKTLVEATKSSGRQLSRSLLLAELERLRDFSTGVVPPLTFGPNRRVGATGVYVVGLDLDNKQYVPLGGRLEPKGHSPNDP